ncbi:MAG: hypothetical protein K6E31_01725, partial [bacterium]|nr:hypothetical protein [bacterium]
RSFRAFLYGRDANYRPWNIGDMFLSRMRFEGAKTPERIRSVLGLLLQRLSKPRYRDLRGLFSVWVGRMIFRNRGILT